MLALLTLSFMGVELLPALQKSNLKSNISRNQTGSTKITKLPPVVFALPNKYKNSSLSTLVIFFFSVSAAVELRQVASTIVSLVHPALASGPLQTSGLRGASPAKPISLPAANPSTAPQSHRIKPRPKGRALPQLANTLARNRIPSRRGSLFPPPLGSARGCPLPEAAAAMSAVNITNVAVLDNPTAFLNPFQFEISYECLVPLDDGTGLPSPLFLGLRDAWRRC